MYTLSSETFAKRRAIFLSIRKTVNIQEYSKLREPIKTRENCYPLIWLILIIINVLKIYTKHTKDCFISYHDNSNLV